LNWTLKIGVDVHHYIGLGIIAAVIIPVVGLFLGKYRKKMELHFRNMGLVNGFDKTPEYLNKQKLPYGRVMMRFDSKGIGINKWKALHSSLEACFDSTIESISHGKTPRYVEIVLNDNVLQKHVDYEETACPLDSRGLKM